MTEEMVAFLEGRILQTTSSLHNNEPSIPSPKGLYDHLLRQLSLVENKMDADILRTVTQKVRVDIHTWRTWMSRTLLNSGDMCQIMPWAMPCRATETKGSWWRVLTKRGPLEKVMVNRFSIAALRTQWTAWKGKKIWPWKMNSPGQ